MTEVTARARWLRMSAYKAREAAQLIRGKSVEEARRILAFTPKASARAVSKVLESAIANAEHNFQIPQEELFVKVASADEAVTIKRFRARAQGRGYRIRKRTCHINLTLERSEAAAAPRPARRAPRRPPASAASAGTQVSGSDRTAEGGARAGRRRPGRRSQQGASTESPSGEKEGS